MAGSGGVTKPPADSGGQRSAYTGGPPVFGKQITEGGRKRVSVRSNDFLDMTLKKLPGSDTWTLFRQTSAEALATGMTLRQAKIGIANLLNSAYVEGDTIYSKSGVKIGVVNTRR